MLPLRLPLCPRCQQAVVSERVSCRSCGAGHHPECWVQSRGCGYYACGGSAHVLPPPEPVVRPAGPRLLPPPAEGGPSVKAGVVGAVALVAFGMVMWLARPHAASPAEEAAHEERAPAAAVAPALPPGLFVCEMAVDLAPGKAMLSWAMQREYAPSFRWGRDGADAEAPVAREGRVCRVKLEGLEPGVAYRYRIGGFPGGPATGTFHALPPSEPVPVRLRTHLLDLPDGATAVVPTFGRGRLAKPLFVREAGGAAPAVAAPGRLVLHDGRHVQALDLADGSVLWTHPLPTAGLASRPVIVGGQVIAAGANGPEAFDLATGAPKWRLPLPGVRALIVAGGDVHVHVDGPPPRLYRVQVPDGHVVSVVPLPSGVKRITASEQHLVLWIEDGPGGEATGANREVLLRALDRLRGERKWEKLLVGAQVPVLPLAARGDRVLAALGDRIEAWRLADGEKLGERALDGAPALMLPVAGGGAVVATNGPLQGRGGTSPRAMLLSAELSVSRSWGLPAVPDRGVVAGGRAALVDGDGVQILELEDGPRWGLTGLPQLASLDLTEDGCLVARWQRMPGEGSAYPEALLALGLR